CRLTPLRQTDNQYPASLCGRFERQPDEIRMKEASIPIRLSHSDLPTNSNPSCPLLYGSTVNANVDLCKINAKFSVSTSPSSVQVRPLVRHQIDDRFADVRGVIGDPLQIAADETE